MDRRAHLPTVTALRVVVALAHHGTVSAAADALHLTQSAVSKQLKGIEDIAGMSLFVRTGRGLQPTEAGAIYIEQARIALGALETAAVRVAGLRPASPRVRLHVLPIVGDRWFIPRFPRFAEAHPDIDVQFTSLAPSDTIEEADVVFRFGEGHWPGWDATYLFGRDVVVVGAPQMIARNGGISHLDDVGRFPVLDHLQTPLRWSAFGAAHGMETDAPGQVIRFGYYALVIRAAILGQGLALVPRTLVVDELTEGRLINPLGLGFASRNCYWLTTPLGRPKPPAVAALCGWILDEAKNSEDPSFRDLPAPD